MWLHHQLLVPQQQHLLDACGIARKLLLLGWCEVLLSEEDCRREVHFPENWQYASLLSEYT